MQECLNARMLELIIECFNILIIECFND